jgi:hypothetical protein
VLWVGAGTKDTGLSLTGFTFQITHATDADTNVERDFIVGELRQHGVIADVTSQQAGKPSSERVNRYIADGDVTVATLRS